MSVQGTVGSVSRSIMEYLNQNFRHLNTVGAYDYMAIAYGYFGVAPEHTDWYCADNKDDAGDPKASAECSSSDATQDPFSYFQSVLRKVIEKSVAAGSDLAPDWTAADLQRKIGISVEGLARYASTALSTSGEWTHFSRVSGRPSEPIAVPAYVVDQMRAQICDPNVDAEIERKPTSEVRDQTRENVKAVRAEIANALKTFQRPWPLLTPEAFPCL